MASGASALAGLPRRAILGRLLPRPFVRSPLALASLAAVVLWILVAISAPAIAPYNPLAQDIVGRLASPSAAHWLGTDPLGRDILSRILYGARLSIPVGITAVTLAVMFGTLIGSVAGVAGGAVDEVIMRMTDLMLAFPTVILAMIISAALGAGIRNSVIAIMVAWWPSYARFARALVLSAREREYVEAARAVGASAIRVYLRHIMVNILSPIVILSTLDVGHAILTFASLSFLGLGPPPQIPEWGSMIASGRDYLDQWWIGTFPGVAILSLVLALNMVGDSLRDALDPRLRKG
ncbi:MAG TPA: ABC transporter permease [bacterium]|nr:ABC transporter permease [bacterium]